MKQESGQFPILLDGAVDFGNGAIGPSASDRNYFNALRSSDQKPLPLKESVLSSPKPKPNLRGLGFLSAMMTSALIASACSGGEMNKQEEEFPRILPLSGEIFLTQGAHANDDSPTGIKSSIDFAPKEVKKCPPGARVIVDQPAVATTSGTITIVGNERDRNDPNHSIVEIKEDKTGLRFGTMHLDDIEKNIQVGEKVNKGDVIGKPSCEVPKGGQTTGVHIHSYVKDANGSFVPINGQEVSGWKIEGDKMTKKGEKTRIADTLRCATDNACGGIRNDLLNTPKTSSKAVLGAATGPIPQISGNVNEKRVEGTIPTPRPTEKPTPTPIAKKENPSFAPTSPEKEIANPIILLPVVISEEATPDFKARGYLVETKKSIHLMTPQPGWKYVYVEFITENRGRNTMLVKLNGPLLNNSILRTQDGFEYRNPVSIDCNSFIYNDPSGLSACQRLNSTHTSFGSSFSNALNSLPPGFRARGVFKGFSDYIQYSFADPNDTLAYVNSVSFKVGEKTSGYRLNVPNLPEIDLRKGVVSLSRLKFPTDRPDSDFKNPGTTINIPGKGSVIFEGIVSRKIDEKRGPKVKIRFRFHNDSVGYAQNFNLITKIFGEDGILYTEMNEKNKGIFPNQPLYWDGYLVSAGEVPPGNDRIEEVDIITSSGLKNGKMVVSGDINEIFNLNLPEITNPVKR